MFQVRGTARKVGGIAREGKRIPRQPMTSKTIPTATSVATLVRNAKTRTTATIPTEPAAPPPPARLHTPTQTIRTGNL